MWFAAPGWRPRTGTDPQRQYAPCLRAAHRVEHRGFVGGRDRDQQIAWLARHPRLRHGIRFDQGNGRQRPLAHDHGVHELDGDMVGVRLPLR